MLVATSPAFAFTAGFPANATIMAEQRERFASLALPVGPWAEDGVPARRVEGAVERRAWRVDTPGIGTLELLAPLRAGLVEQGYTILFECSASECGGFDFRFAIDVLPEPEMHVDLGDYRFLAAERTGEDGGFVSVLVSRSSRAGFVQMIRLDPDGAGPQMTASTKAAPPVARALAGPSAVALPSAEAPVGSPGAASAMAQALAESAVALEDIIFETGSAQLDAGDTPSLGALAAYLAANPDHRVAIVGHTDASGGLEGNVALSKRRAEAVRKHLIEAHGADPDQVMATGVGYLSPRDSNLTAEGRARNRRVEVILTATD